jgi:hypothetical protein
VIHDDSWQQILSVCPQHGNMWSSWKWQSLQILITLTWVAVLLSSRMGMAAFSFNISMFLVENTKMSLLPVPNHLTHLWQDPNTSNSEHMGVILSMLHTRYWTQKYRPIW